MIEVVMPFTQSDDCSDKVISRRVSVIVWLVPKIMRERVGTESCLIDKESANDSSLDESSTPVAPAQICHRSGKERPHAQSRNDIDVVLPHDNSTTFYV